MVGANLLSLVTSHEDPVVTFVGVFQDPDVSCPALLPLGRVGRSVPSVQLGPDLNTTVNSRSIFPLGTFRLTLNTSSSPSSPVETWTSGSETMGG